MAPEVILAGYKEGTGEQLYYDKKIDVWSVGKLAISHYNVTNGREIITWFFIIARYM